MTLSSQESLVGISSHFVGFVRYLHPNFITFYIVLCIHAHLICRR
ncbi:hypothetical protein PspLS_11766 [Pyricularia sp. CBS 133598]|nr:hypothetical protein PspLS_11766 [Pyricularia sp. CBS 133598]